MNIMSYPHLIVVCFLLALCFQCQGFKNLYINRQINFKTISPLVSRKITLQATNAVLTTTATPSIVSKLTTVLLCVSKFALNPAISGGVLSGALHAVTGPDHLAAIFPSSIGKSYLSGMKLGAAWGLGHSVSASILGLGGYLLKGRFTAKLSTLQKVSALTETAVGLSLLLIGVIGVKENLAVEPEDASNSDKSASGTKKQAKSIKALFVNGFIHGFSWDGAPSLAPALAMNSWGAAVSFILAYCFGTTAIMSATAGAVGESTLRLNKIVQSKDLTRNLSIGSSLIAIGVGIFWILNVVFGSA